MSIKITKIIFNMIKLFAFLYDLCYKICRNLKEVFMTLAEKYEEGSNIMKVVWFFLKIIIVDTLIIFLLSRILETIGWLNILSSLFLIIFAFVLFIALILLLFTWEQIKAIENDDKNFIIHRQ